MNSLNPSLSCTLLITYLKTSTCEVVCSSYGGLKLFSYIIKTTNSCFVILINYYDVECRKITITLYANH